MHLRHTIATLALLTLALSTAAQPSPRYRLVWQDDFNGREIDPQSWSMMKRIPFDASRYWSQEPSLYQLSGGRLRLFARLNDGIAPADTARFLTAALTTEHKRTVSLGKIEVRARIKGAQGVWPAIWLLRGDSFFETHQTGYAEIDLMEYLNRDSIAYQTVHTYYTLQKGAPTPQTRPRIRRNRWNTYAVEILPDRLIFSVNGTPTMTYRRDTVLSEADGQWPFGAEMYLMIDMQVGGAWVGKPDSTQFPAYMDIDWVRFYRLE